MRDDWPRALSRQHWWQGLLCPAHTLEPEWTDLPGHSPAVLRENLQDMARVNRWLGGIRLTRRALERLLHGARVRPGATVTVLDVAAGAADIPQALLRWARRHGYRLHVLATDVSPDIALVARSASESRPDLLFAAADGVALPIADGAFDIAICSLALHHMKSPAQAVHLLRELMRVSRLGFVVNDIVRSWVGYGGAWWLTRVGSRSKISWHDGPLSVRRAYTVGEMRSLAAEAGAAGVEFERFALYRVAMTWRRPAASDG